MINIYYDELRTRKINFIGICMNTENIKNVSKLEEILVFIYVFTG